MPKSCNHFQPSIAEPGDCLICEREETSRGPLVSYSGGRDNWREGQTTGEYLRSMKEDAKHLPPDRQPEYAGPRSRWV